MFEPFASEEQMCAEFSSIKIGDSITVLTDKYVSDKGIVKKGTSAIVDDVVLRCDADVPRISLDELCKEDYCIGCEEYIFLYRVVVDGLDDTLLCNWVEIALGNISVEAVDDVYAQKNSIIRKQRLSQFAKGVILFFVISAAIFFVLNLLPFHNASTAIKIFFGIFGGIPCAGLLTRKLFPLGYVKKANFPAAANEKV